MIVRVMTNNKYAHHTITGGGEKKKVVGRKKRVLSESFTLGTLEGPQDVRLGPASTGHEQ